MNRYLILIRSILLILAAASVLVFPAALIKLIESSVKNLKKETTRYGIILAAAGAIGLICGLTYLGLTVMQFEGK